MAGSKIALAAYIGFFPVFFAYHVLAAFGMPMFAGAWWGGCTAVVAAVLLPVVLLRMASTGSYRIHAPVVLLGAIIALAALYYWRFGNSHQQDAAMLVGSAKLIIALAALYSIGFLIRADENSTAWLRRALYAMVAVAVLFMDPFDGSFIPAEWDDARGVAGYQWIAQAILFTGIAAMCFTKSERLQIAVLATMLAGLVLSASRAELYLGAVPVLLGWAVVKLFRGKWSAAFIGALIFLAVFMGARSISPTYIAAGHAVEWVISHTSGDEVTVVRARQRGQTAARYAEVMDIQSSQSWAERQKFFASGWAAIKASPIVGDYGGQIRDHGFFGSYIHNALSAWRQYGIVAFTLYALLTLLPPFVAAGHVLWRKSDDPIWLMTLFVGGVALLMVASVKAVYWPLPALAWGLYAAARSFKYGQEGHSAD